MCHSRYIISGELGRMMRKISRRTVWYQRDSYLKGLKKTTKISFSKLRFAPKSQVYEAGLLTTMTFGREIFIEPIKQPREWEIS